jgi:hypothetical protein
MNLIGIYSKVYRLEDEPGRVAISGQLGFELPSALWEMVSGHQFKSFVLLL